MIAPFPLGLEQGIHVDLSPAAVRVLAHGDDQGAERNTAAMTAVTEKAVELRGFMGVDRVVGERGKYTDNIHGNFD